MKNTTKRILIIGLVGVALVLGGGYAAYHGYIYARQTRLLKQARGYIDRHTDSGTRKAILCLQRVLRTAPDNVEACRLMAELTQAARSPAAILWRTRVLELNPRSLDDRLALVQTALVFRDHASATNALEGVAPAGRKTFAYHNLAGTVAAATGQPAQAEAHFLEAVRLEPQNAVPQLNLAVIRLVNTNAATLAEARAALTRLSSNSTNGTLRCQALRELAADALRYKQTGTALALSKQLLAETNSIFADRLLQLNLLKETKSSEFDSTLVAFQREAASDPAKTYELAVWQMAKMSPAQTLAWFQTLPPAARTNQAVLLLIADCYSVQQDWRALQAAVENQNWGELEFVRHAFRTRSLRGQDFAGAAKGEWEMTMKVANAQKGSLVMLLRLVAQWRWQSETEELLWAIVNRYPEEHWAFAALSQALYVGGRTRPLMMLFSQQAKRAPGDPALKNNLAMTALLLGANELKPHDLAREAHLAAPTNAAYASTYAFSLHIQGKNAEALKALEQLTPKQLGDPGIAGYYGLILKAAGNDAKARSYLESASKGRLLPEERKLFERALAGT